MTLIGGSHRLGEEVERELGSRDARQAPPVGETDRHLQAAWERAEAARLLRNADFPLLNAWCVAQHVFALDALIEEFTPSVQEVLIDHRVREVFRLVAERQPTLAEALAAGHEDHLLAGIIDGLIGNARFPQRPAGAGLARYERGLQDAGMWPLPAIPADMERALIEAHVIRDVVAHRGGFVDGRALDKDPDFPYASGKLLRLNSGDYRKYSAAVRAFAYLVTSGDATALEHWREDHLVGP